MHKHIEYLPVTDLKAAARNARTHSDKQVAQIARSIERFGFTNPVLIGDDLTIIAGHGRLAAAKKLGLADVPCLRLSHLSAAERRAYVIADNQLALNAGWDREVLALELGDLVELGFDVELTGFELPEIDLMLATADDAASEGPEHVDVVPEVAHVAVSRLGDLWRLGRHVLLCGDAKNATTFERLMAGGKADAIFTDAPYNVPIAGHVSGLGRTKHREFAEGVGEMSRDEFTAFLETTLGNAAAVCRPGAIAFSCIDWRHVGEMLAAGEAALGELKNICVWNKTNGGMGSLYRSQHELVLVFKIGTAPHTNNVELGRHGRNRTNVWTYAGVNTFRADRMDELSLHPTVKPVALIADAIRDVTHRGDVVLDCFGGSGSTLIAAESTGRAARLLEIDPLYCDVIVRRYERFTGKQAVLASTGRSFERTEIERVTGWTSTPAGRAA